MFNIIMKMIANDTSDAFAVTATNNGEELRCFRRAAEFKEINEGLAELAPDTYFLIAGASWDGKYVLRSFTNESFSSEFVVTVVKE